MACSYKPLTELSKHFSPSLLAPSDSPPTSSFRASGPLHASGNGSHTPCAIERDWSTFAAQAGGMAAGSQMEAMPPFASSSSSTAFASFGPGQTSSTFVQEPIATPSHTRPSDDNLSAYWNPEQEALRYLSSSPAPSSTSSHRSTYSVPTSDEAASISSTPLTSSTSLYPLSKSTSLEDHFSPPPSTTAVDPTSSQTPPHPLTYTAPVHTAWDFDKLFSRRRRWFGGVRVPSEGFFFNGEASIDEGEEAERTGRSSTAQLMLERQEAQDRARSVERARSRDARGREQSGLCREIGEEDEGMKERQRRAFEGMRAVAMERLKAVGSHLDWEGSS